MVPPDQLDATVTHYVREALSASPTAVARAKALIPRVAGRPPADVMAITAEAIAAQRVSPEGQDGLAGLPDQGHTGLDPGAAVTAPVPPVESGAC